MLKILYLLVVATLTLLANENNYELSCARPMTTHKPTTNYEIKQYNEKSRYYKNCIDDFIQEHKEIRDRHNDAIQNAIKQWNNYVNNVNPKKDEGQKFHGKTGVSQGNSHTVGYSDPTQIFTNVKF